MAEAVPGGMVYGVDPSGEMARLSRDVNRELIEAGRVEILESGVSELSFNNEEFDLVTAFESFYFWPDPVRDLGEIRRVLKPGGKVLLANEAYEDERFDKRNERWTRMVGGLKFYTPERYREFLADAGFAGVDVELLPDKNWIKALATK
jgi:ubiquinone/menaquinone biosynthesis C-methylase UbiE